MGTDNPVRFIDAFVDGLDLEPAGFERVQANRTGRPGYDPADLLKLYLYGYLNRIRSSRRLEAETHRNLEVIWLLRRLRPDFKTIADFRRDNREAFRQVFREFMRLCRELLAVDGTRIRAVNNVNRNFTRAKLERELNTGSVSDSCPRPLSSSLSRYSRKVARHSRSAAIFPSRSTTTPPPVSSASASSICLK